MSFTVCVPWRPDDAERSRNWAWLRPRMQLAGSTLIEGHDPAGAAATRNLLVQQADTEIVVILDADVLAPSEAITDLATLAAQTRGYVAGHTDIHYLTEAQTVEVIAGKDVTYGELERHSRTWFGLVAFPRALWEQVGGFDERFGEWGRFEIAFWHACKTFAPLDRIPGTVYHLWHPARDPVWTPAGNDLLRRYETASGNREAMAALVTEPR